MVLAICIILAVLALCSYLFATKTEKGREIWNTGLGLYIRSRGNLAVAWRMIRSAQTGKVTMDVLLMAFILIIIIYQLIPQIGSQNTALQASANVSAMGKWAAGLGEWLFPLLGVVAIVFLMWGKRGGKKGVA